MIKDCLVIAPIGEPGSDVRLLSERVFEDVIKPAAQQCDYSATHAMDITRPGLITTEIIKRIVNDPLVIADLTGGNPNVFYELALRHAVGMPVVQIIAKGEKIAFDVEGVRTIDFNINVVGSRKEAIEKIVKQIEDIEKSDFSLETPISVTGADSWVPFPESRQAPPVATPSPSVKHIDDVVQILESLTRAEAVPAIIKYIEGLTKDPRVHLLKRPIDDLDAACTVVNSVPDGGCISATSSLQNEDAEDYEAYRTAMNLALERRVRYRKVICSSSDLWPDRREKWLEELTEKANLISSGKIEPDAFQLLHYPSPMSVDVLISQDAKNECQEMVAGFAGGGGQHGGFRTDDKRMVEEWLNIYLEAKIIAAAKKHTEAVLGRKESCRCLEFLKLLEDARHAATQPEHGEGQHVPEAEAKSDGAVDESSSNTSEEGNRQPE